MDTIPKCDNWNNNTTSTLPWQTDINFTFPQKLVAKKWYQKNGTFKWHNTVRILTFIHTPKAILSFNNIVQQRNPNKHNTKRCTLQSTTNQMNKLIYMKKVMLIYDKQHNTTTTKLTTQQQPQQQKWYNGILQQQQTKVMHIE